MNVNKLLIFMIALAFLVSVNFAFAVDENVTDIAMDSIDEDVDVSLQVLMVQTRYFHRKLMFPILRLFLQVR